MTGNEKGQTVSVVKTGETLVITRVDSHVCAGCRRLKTSDLKVLSCLKTPHTKIRMLARVVEGDRL